MANKEENKKGNKDWAEMSDGEEEVEETEQTQQVEEKEKKKVPAAKKGFKNDRGDYVVTTIDIGDMRSTAKKEQKEKEEESDSDTEYDDEDDAKEETKVEEKKEGKFSTIVVFYPSYRSQTGEKAVQERVESSRRCRVRSNHGWSEGRGCSKNRREEGG